MNFTQQTSEGLSEDSIYTSRLSSLRNQRACLGQTKAGKPCTQPANVTGYCRHHHPFKQGTKRATNITLESHLKELQQRYERYKQRFGLLTELLCNNREPANDEERALLQEYARYDRHWRNAFIDELQLERTALKIPLYRIFFDEKEYKATLRLKAVDLARKVDTFWLKALSTTGIFKIKDLKALHKAGINELREFSCRVVEDAFIDLREELPNITPEQEAYLKNRQGDYVKAIKKHRIRLYGIDLSDFDETLLF